MANSWSYVPNDTYKSPRVLIHMLADVVSKGGNLLLNIGPGPDGAWHDAAYDRLAALGAWMKVNSEAIYGTHAIAPYADGKVRLTQAKDSSVYAIYLAEEGETELPRYLSLGKIVPAVGATVTLLGTSRALQWEKSGTGFVARVPGGLHAPSAYAWVFKISRVQRP
jgi:alpha-L-fucosidase